MSNIPGHQLPPQAHQAHQAQSRSNHPQTQRLDAYKLSVIQQPMNAKAATGKDKDRKPVDPPPILRLSVPPDEDPDGVYRQSPYLIVVAYLEYGPDEEHPRPSGAIPPPNVMSGTMVSSLHRLKDPSNQEGAFFIFGDLTIKNEGVYVLRFDLLQMEFGNTSSDSDSIVTITSTTSEPFRVHASKAFPGMAESTFLTRSFSDQGVRLRLRKDSRTLHNRKRTQRIAERSERGSAPSTIDRQMNHMERQTLMPSQQSSVSHHHAGSRQSSLAQNGHLPQLPEQYYEGDDYGDEQGNKRHRTGSSSIHSGTPTTSEGGTDMRAWAAYPPTSGPPYQGQGSMGSLAGGPPHMPPPGSRIDTHYSSLHQSSPMTPSSMHHSPIHFGNAGSQGSSHPYIFTGNSTSSHTPTLNLAPMGSHSQTAMNTPTMSNTSPRSYTQINGATPTGTASPVGANMYTTAPPTSGTPQSRQASYAHAGYHNLPNTFDHTTISEHGMATPLTGSMPPESISGPYNDNFGGLVKSDPNA
ncbi:hypothetical protein F5Y15DRAFT_412624 [Xylariaceae sp. FL0016]|nr:hypothetical protein F5Y15DRAFT_412624 [Xylariaceae sp. FL0016]